MFSNMSWGLGWSGETLKGRPCQGFGQGPGPYDYRDPQLQKRVKGEHLEIVEKFHFNSNVENLIKGINSPIPGDHDYTLRAFPNHHRALWSLMRFYQGKGKGRQFKYPPPECYFQRALVFQPKDTTVLMLYAIYLQRNRLFEKADKYYKKSLEINEKQAETHYNYGMLLIEMKKNDLAIIHARRAYELGYPLPGLRDRLEQAGYSFSKNTE